MLLGPRTVGYRRAFWFQQPDLLLIFWYSSTDQESVVPKRTSASAWLHYGCNCVVEK